MWSSGQVDLVLGDWLARPTRDPRGFAVALRFARQYGSSKVLRRLAEVVAEALHRDSLLIRLPLV